MGNIFSKNQLLVHQPVLLKEVIFFLRPQKGQIFIDATLGLGGHSQAILEKISSSGQLIGLEQDQSSLKIAQKNLAHYQNVIFINQNFKNLKRILSEKRFGQVDGILMDLGLSSWQLEFSGRGFSFQKDEPLDMRYNQNQELTAAKIINHYSLKKLAKIFWQYGEEKYGFLIAKQIIKNRADKNIQSTKELVTIIDQSLPERYKRRQKIHFATKIFQALRIAVNDELVSLKKAIPQAVELLKTKGRIIIISFHSLEDRIVKKEFKKLARGCVCPSKSPICTCGQKPQIKILTKKPIKPDQKEIEKNPRSRSAKLRAAEKI